MNSNLEIDIKNVPLFFSDSYKVRAYEAGPDGRVTIHSICNYLQDAASNHAFRLGVAVDKLQKHNLTWVLSRFHVQMKNYPFWLDEVKIDTWPLLKEKYHAVRDFRLFNSKNQEIGTATSSWMMIDTQKRTTVPLPDFMEKLQNHEAGRALNDPFTKLPKIENSETGKIFNVRLSDLDMNRHVNSVHYLSWGLETIPIDFRKKHFLTDVEINYRAECSYGEKIISRNEMKNSGSAVVFIHQLFKENDGREITRMRSSWQKK